MPTKTRSQTAEAILNQLKNPIDPKFVKCRVGATSKDKSKGIALFYLDAREVMKRLDEVLGIDGWQTKKIAVSGGIICELSIKMPYLDNNGNTVWITKSDAGEETKVYPLKGASSDSFKRAAMNFGVGRYLYYIPNQWYPLTEFKTFKTEPKLPSWAEPNPNILDWETVAIQEYDPEKDIDLDYLDLDFVDDEAKEILLKSQQVKKDIIARMKGKK